MEKVVIVGGGIAGLSCMNALLDHGISPLLLEASTIGLPKICGEFLGPPAVPLLKQWGIGPFPAIEKAQFFGAPILGKTSPLRLTFPREAGAYSRHHAEEELAARAQNMGGRIMEQAPIKIIIPATHSSPYTLHLVSGEVIHARDVIFATGKFSHMPVRQRQAKYMGFKTHIPHVIAPHTLLMFGLFGGYLGIVPISSQVSNVTCLIKRDVIEKAGSCAIFLNHLADHYAPLKQLLESNSLTTLDWLEGDSPDFGLKIIPKWPHAYWIGDAYASVHPAVGFGFAHSVTSAKLAADHYLKDDPVGYHYTLQRTIRPKRMLGRTMHHVLQKPRLCSALSPLIGDNHWITHRLLNLLDY